MVAYVESCCSMVECCCLAGAHVFTDLKVCEAKLGPAYTGQAVQCRLLLYIAEMHLCFRRCQARVVTVRIDCQ